MIRIPLKFEQDRTFAIDFIQGQCLTRGLWAVTTVLEVFFLYLPEKFKVFDKKKLVHNNNNNNNNNNLLGFLKLFVVHYRVESEKWVVAKWMKS